MAARCTACDLSRPCQDTAREAVQAAVPGLSGRHQGEQRRRHLSLGRTSTFLDIYFQRDLEAGVLTEEQAQEI